MNLPFTLLERNALWRYFARLPEEQRLQVIRAAHSRILADPEIVRALGHAEASYASILRECSTVRWAEKGIKRKREIGQDDLARLTALSVQRVRQRKQKKHSIRHEIFKGNLWKVIQNLRKKEKLGWRKIADYLALNHNLKISHTYCKKIYDGLKPT